MTWSFWRTLPKTQCNRMMKIGGNRIKKDKGEIHTTRLTKYFPFSAAWQGCFRVEEGRTRLMGNTRTTVICCSTFNCAQFISFGFFPSHFINLFKGSIKSSLVLCYICYCWAEVIAKQDIYLPEPAHARDGGGHVLKKFDFELFQVSTSH